MRVLLYQFWQIVIINPPTAVLQPVAKAVCENGAVSFLGNGSVTLHYNGSKY